MIAFALAASLALSAPGSPSSCDARCDEVITKCKDVCKQAGKDAAVVRCREACGKAKKGCLDQCRAKQGAPPAQ